jgi:hypothetical protein
LLCVQQNAAMRPFRNKGWDYLSRMESIIPVSGAKGHHVFVASAATSSSQMLADELDISDGEEEDLPDAIKAAGDRKAGGDGKVDGGDGKVGSGDGKAGDGDYKIGNIESMIGGPMDIDQLQIGASASVSSSSKRKHSLLDIGASSLSSGHPTSVPTSSKASSEPASKKANSTKGKNKQLASKRSVKSFSSSVACEPSSARAAKVTNTTILHGMQGTMNRVTDIFERSITQPADPQSGARDEALDLLQTREDSLSLDDMKKLVNLFMKDIIIAQTYIRLVNEDLRQIWLADMAAAE